MTVEGFAESGSFDGPQPRFWQHLLPKIFRARAQLKAALHCAKEVSKEQIARFSFPPDTVVAEVRPVVFDTA